MSKHKYVEIIEEFREERWRQINKLGYTPEHDDQHNVSIILEMMDDHINLAISGNAEDPHKEMVQAGALFIAAIERFDRHIKEQ